MALAYSDLSTTFTDSVTKAQTNLETQLKNYDPQSSTSADLINLQFAIQKWSMTADMSSNTLKTIGEGMRNSIANIK